MTDDNEEIKKISGRISDGYDQEWIKRLEKSVRILA